MLFERAKAQRVIDFGIRLGQWSYLRIHLYSLVPLRLPCASFDLLIRV